MSAADELRDLLRGRRPADGLLQTIRLETAGGDFYGEEAVLERGRGAPTDLAEAGAVRAPGHLLLFGADVAAVADLHGERVGRVWALAAGAPAEPEPAVGVAFDPNLAQARGDVSADAADHPALDPAMLDRLVEAATTLLAEIADGSPPAYRVRAFLIRAWSEGGRSAGLFAVHSLGPGPVRAARWSHAVVLVDGADVRTWRDWAGEATTVPWRATL